MKMLSLLMLSALISATACTHRSKCAGAEKMSCDKKEENASCKKDQKCEGEKCKKDEIDQKKS